MMKVQDVKILHTHSAEMSSIKIILKKKSLLLCQDYMS